MAYYKQDWEDLGRNIQDIVDRAVNSHDYQRLNQTIRQAVGRAVDLGGEAVRKVADEVAAKTAYAEAKRSVVETRELSTLYGSTNGKTAIGILKTVGGGLLSALAFTVFLSSLALDLLISGAVQLTFPLLVSLAGLGGGALLITGGVRSLSRLGRFKTYRKILGQKTYCTLEKLARGVGKNVKYVRKELRKMIDEGLFPEGHLDKEETRLIISHDTYRYFEQSRLQLEQRQKQEAEIKAQKAANPLDPKVQEILDRGDAYIAQIRSCNDAIPGEEISRKISCIENIVQRIFDRAEAHPEVIPDLKKMMDYYLPMTVKLLNAYAEMDAQPIQGDTIQNSKREIEATLDTLNLAFEKLLDELFEDTALDVSSDISVLRTLLAQEGLTDTELDKLKKERSS